MREVRQLSMFITPDILTNKLYLVDFVPVLRQSWHANQRRLYLEEGMYVARIRVRQGKRDEVYSYKENDEDNFVIRRGGHMDKIEGREVLRLGKARMEEPAPPAI